MKILTGLVIAAALALGPMAWSTAPARGCGYPPLHDTAALFSRDALQSFLAEQPRSPVDRIAAAEKICALHQVDARHLLLESDGQSYLLRVRPHCGGLPWARRVGITAPNGEIWKGFDAVSLDGRRCDIQAIERLPGY